MDEYVEFANRLRTTIWRTSGARFWAARRFERKERLSSFSIALLSVVIIFAGILDARPGTANVIGAVSLVLASLFVLVLSLIESSSKYSVKAFCLHSSANQLRDLQTQLDFVISRSCATGSTDWALLEKVQEDYAAALAACPENHRPIDDLRFRCQHRLSKEFKDQNGHTQIGCIRAFWISIRYEFDAFWLPVLSWILTAIIIGCAFTRTGQLPAVSIRSSDVEWTPNVVTTACNLTVTCEGVDPPAQSSTTGLN